VVQFSIKCRWVAFFHLGLDGGVPWSLASAKLADVRCKIQL
jgi:hypothetical protein